MPSFKKGINNTPTLQVFKNRVPRVGISPDALAKMSQYIDQCNDEIGWLGTAEKLDEETYYIKDTFLFEQDVHSTTTEITPEGLEKFAESLLELGEEGLTIWNEMKMWGHSHVRMSVSPSGQDNAQMETFEEGGHDWFIRLIGNKNGDMRIDIYDYAKGVIYNNVPWIEVQTEEEVEIQRQIDELYKRLDEIAEKRENEIKSFIEAEIKEKVRRITYQSSYYNNQKKISTATDTTTRGMTDFGEDTKPTPSNLSDLKYMLFSVDNYALTKCFSNDDDVVKEFTKKDLIAFGECKTLYELDDLLVDDGYYGYFHIDDLERIYRVAIKVKTKEEGSSVQ